MSDGIEKHDIKFARLETKLGKIDTKIDPIIETQNQHSMIIDVLAARSIRHEADIQMLKKLLMPDNPGRLQQGRS